MSDTLDLELRLGLGPHDVAPRARSNGAPAEVSDHGETVQLVEAAGEEEEEEAAAAAETGSKRAKAEPPAAHRQGGGGSTEPAWVRAELVARHGFPGDLPLHFVQEKVLTGSDLQSDQSRLLFCSAGSACLRPFLSAVELTLCGLDEDGARRRRRQERRTAAPAPGQGQDGAEKKKKREKTRFPGVPVLVYERGAERAALRLNSFRSSMGIVINGLGYKRFVAGSGFRKGDRVEVWAFRRPHDQHLCFVIAKRDDAADQAAMQE
ncbi:unnamed protein product [Urochloa decumbens]|uniref:S1-like domain-containing protein n=1 Tax=Urochloa decumbens TaxID=240449 RepID=A0ABC8Y4B6_9POAL